MWHESMTRQGNCTDLCTLACLKTSFINDPSGTVSSNPGFTWVYCVRRWKQCVLPGSVYILIYIHCDISHTRSLCAKCQMQVHIANTCKYTSNLDCAGYLCRFCDTVRCPKALKKIRPWSQGRCDESCFFTYQTTLLVTE